MRDTKVNSGIPRVLVQRQGANVSVEVKGKSGVQMSEDQIYLRKFKQGVELDEIRSALRGDGRGVNKGNNLDEVVFRTQSGELYVVYADELDDVVERGDAISIGSIKGTVEIVDNEWNESRVGAGVYVAAVLTVGTAGAALAAAAVPVAGMSATGAMLTEAAFGVFGLAAGGTVGNLVGWIGTKAANLTTTDDTKLRKISDEFIP